MGRCENCNKILINEVEEAVGLCARCERKQPVAPKDLVEFEHTSAANTNQENEA
ncbi:hypothetical protein ACFS7Z_13715 [Pontibacter toksunensis]|uniref:DksA C4-type domain-containing protein n=1 Tax=Pontibacter toksunensis TaxID=1332631 RepID=A0ABW6BUI8_9BACT